MAVRGYINLQSMCIELWIETGNTIETVRPEFGYPVRPRPADRVVRRHTCHQNGSMKRDMHDFNSLTW